MSHWPRLCGALMQGAILGVLLFLAIMKMAGMAMDARVFRYQGF